METFKRRSSLMILALAGAVLMSRPAIGGQGHGRAIGPGVSCPGCAAGVVGLVMSPAFQVDGRTRRHLTSAFWCLSEWLRTSPGRHFLMADPTWKPLAQMSFEDPGDLKGVISIAAVSPLMAMAEPKWKGNVQVEGGKVEELIYNADALVKDPKNVEKRNAVFELLGMLRQEARSSVADEVKILMDNHLVRELPESREELRAMLSDMKAVAGFLSLLKLYRYSDRHGKQIDDAVAAVLRRKQELEDMLSKDLLAKAGRVVKGLGESEEGAVEAGTPGEAAQERVEDEEQGRAYDFGSFNALSIKTYPDGGTMMVTGVVQNEFPARIRYDGQSSSKTRGRFFVWVPFIPTGEPIEDRGMKREELGDLEKALQNWIGENQEHRDILSYKRFVERIGEALKASPKVKESPGLEGENTENLGKLDYPGLGVAPAPAVLPSVQGPTGPSVAQSGTRSAGLAGAIGPRIEQGWAEGLQKRLRAAPAAPGPSPRYAGGPGGEVLAKIFSMPAFTPAPRKWKGSFKSLAGWAQTPDADRYLGKDHSWGLLGDMDFTRLRDFAFVGQLSSQLRVSTLINMQRLPNLRPKDKEGMARALELARREAAPEMLKAAEEIIAQFVGGREPWDDYEALKARYEEVTAAANVLGHLSLYSDEIYKLYHSAKRKQYRIKKVLVERWLGGEAEKLLAGSGQVPVDAPGSGKRRWPENWRLKKPSKAGGVIPILAAITDAAKVMRGRR